MMQNLKITDLHYHRNGISGVGFTVAKFTFTDDGKSHNAIATVFSTPKDEGEFTGYCAVLTLDENGRPEIDNKWRGDHFENDLRKFIESEDGKAMMFPSLYKKAS